MFTALVLLQALHVAFLALHDWVPLGRWNDVRAVRLANPGGALFRTTLLSTLPYAFGLAISLYYAAHHSPGWLHGWLWGSYGFLFVGELQAWWVPYFFGTSDERVARYQAMFGSTTAFLPARHRVQPNALHVMLHLATLATLVLLVFTPSAHRVNVAVQPGSGPAAAASRDRRPVTMALARTPAGVLL